MQNNNVRDNSSKIIFDDSVLCAQFLNGYVKSLGNANIVVHPEDIEDVSERYVPLIAEERYSDTVKRINVPGRSSFYFVSLIEHKIKVDYNVSMQIFRYIYQIWEDYEKEMEKQHKGISKTRNFKYPPVLPIVYYEGKEKWTAPRDFKCRVSGQELFGNSIPDFTYELVQLSDFSNEELLDRGDAISLLMMLGKIKTVQDIQYFMELPTQRLTEIIAPMPGYLVKKIAQIFRVWLFAMNTPEEEVEKIVSRVEEKDMGRLFEGMEIDIQLERRKLSEERKQLSEEKSQLSEEKSLLSEEKSQLSEERELLNNGKIQLKEEQNLLAEEKQGLEQEKQGLEQEKQGLEQEKQGLEQEKQGLEQEKQGLEQEKQDLEQEKRALEQEKQDLEQARQEIADMKSTVENMMREVMDLKQRLIEEQKLP